MICKFCNAEVDDELELCPNCGKELFAETESEEQVLEEVTELAAEETTEEVAEEAIEQVAEETAEQVVEQDSQPSENAPKKQVWPLVLAIVGGVLVLLTLAVTLLLALGVDFKGLLPKENNLWAKESYTVTDEKALKASDKVIATINGKELTNTQLQIFYRMQVLDFLNYYGAYVSYVGMDYTKPFSEQTCYYDESMTWEQYFLDVSLDTWQNYQTLALLAEEAGYTMSQEWQESLDALPEDLIQQAEEGEFESVDAMLEELIGPGCDEEDYLKYVGLIYLSNDFYASEYERLAPSDADVEAYFAANEETFSQQGITKESGLNASVRHILISPEGGTTDEETGETTYTDEEWAACQEKAQQLLDEWKAGDATEESFAALVEDNTADGGSASTGGLYEDIYKGSGMVEPFETWCVEATRQPGDTGLVKTEFGYHIMYFVSGEPNWQIAARTQLLSELTTAMIDEAEAQWPMKVNYKKISLAELEF